MKFDCWWFNWWVEYA